MLPVAEDEVEVREYLRRKRSSRIERQRTFTNETIREAVKLWCTDKEAAISRFGHIRDWDTSACTDMHSLFIGQSSFNDDISGYALLLVARTRRSLCSRCAHRWDTSEVTTMCQARTMQKVAYNCSATAEGHFARCLTARLLSTSRSAGGARAKSRT
jgi:hypothetical protein